MEQIILKANKREITGRKVKHLRAEGKIPAVLYGKKQENENLVIDKIDFNKTVEKAGSSTLVDLIVDEKNPVKVLIHEPQVDPVSDEIIHADLYKVNMEQEIRTEIPLKFVGVSAAVEDLEGNLITNKDALEIECLPGNLVSEIEVDISVLKTFEDLIKVSDLKIPAEIEVLSEPDEIITQVTPPRSEEELQEMEEEASADAEKAQIENIESAAEKEKVEKEAAKEGEEGSDQPAESPKESPAETEKESK